jgi:hypothetical protein
MTPLWRVLFLYLSGSGDFREPSRMTAMEQLIAEQSVNTHYASSPVVSSAPKKLSVPNAMQDPRQVNQGLPLSLLKTGRIIVSRDKTAKDSNAGVSIAGYTAMHQNLLLRVHKTAALHCLPKKSFRRIILSPHQILVLDHPPPTQD